MTNQDHETYTIDDDLHPTVIVMHASVGSGHRSAAQSIRRAFEALAAEGTQLPADLRVEFIDVLTLGRTKVDGNATASMFIGPTRWVYDLTWRYTFTGRLLWGGGTIWSHVMFPSFTDHIKKVKPIAVVTTHIVAANVAASARMLTGQDYPIVSVPTDYETEGFWPHKGTDLFCVANESMVETLRARKIEDSRILITGIPTREGFAVEHERDACREQFGLPKDKRLALVLAGAALPKPYQNFRATMDKALAYAHMFKDTQLVFVTGKDQDYATSLTRRAKELNLDNITVLGYVNDMAALMAACDVAICKSGGLVVTECICAQIPMILLGRAYGQERVNVNMLTASGAAMHVTTPNELAQTVLHLEMHPEVCEALLINGSFLRRPNAAKDIALATYNLSLQKIDPANPRRKKHFIWLYWGHKPAHVR